MVSNDISGDDNPKLELGLLYHHVIKPDDERWRELMLDLGAPLATNWWLASRVEINHMRQDLPFDVSEVVSIRDEGGWAYPSEGEIARVNPAYKLRLRAFLYDSMPRLEDVTVLSDRFPSRPFFEAKLTAGGTPLMAAGVRVEMLHSSVMQTEGARFLRWWAALLNGGEQQADELMARTAGRPKTFRNRADYIAALDWAASEIKRAGQAVTQSKVAEFLTGKVNNGLKVIDARQIRKWCDRF